MSKLAHDREPRIVAATTWMMVAFVVPWRLSPPPRAKSQGGLFEFRPVVRNTSAFAYSVVYGVHTLEMSALRGRGVAFLAFVASHTDLGDETLSPVLVVTLLALLSTLTSIVGNEAPIRFGRR